ncbi:type IV toxin-antitoxin system AbiEi family antitoxin domain-containing protein [Rhodococcus sp. G-MC3]|uniref:type IV toxin-antitoxin system AbiEi family antitoxin domain-containing protein n=1 Tax=Rhodococcus sp. G-MC3 TaxID=3046209 RepID=UPI0024B8BD84|nr:type IV toxin-antitoxin system AbiEi family antitoxin domain-containing protein [Rhodococcus sp. G-MC3]MDJ0393921.1 type IV toxin-antitoxin system AbiEi family antitoxin domain-containing protein [Rhodococcus sp. G-MC3]
MDFDQPGMFSRSDALHAGYTDEDLKRARSQGLLHTIRRGYFLRTEVLRSLDPHARHLILAEATYSESSSKAVFSHVTAAVLHRLETWQIPLDKVTLTIDRTYASKRGRQRVLHGSPLPDEDFTEIDGFPVTTVSRTIADLCRSMPLVPSVCIGDYALRTGLTTMDELHSAVGSAKNRTGIAKARQAIGSMSEASASVGETRSRLQLDTLPLPPPLLDQRVYDEEGSLVGSAGFLYPNHGVIGMFEGTGTYGADPTPPDFEGRRRRHRMEDLGWIVVRWNWQDLDTPKALTNRVARGFVRAAENKVPRGRFSART